MKLMKIVVLSTIVSLYSMSLFGTRVSRQLKSQQPVKSQQQENVVEMKQQAAVNAQPVIAQSEAVEQSSSVEKNNESYTQGSAFLSALPYVTGTFVTALVALFVYNCRYYKTPRIPAGAAAPVVAGGGVAAGWLQQLLNRMNQLRGAQGLNIGQALVEAEAGR